MKASGQVKKLPIFSPFPTLNVIFNVKHKDRDIFLSDRACFGLKFNVIDGFFGKQT
jgi:hypothetical protein